LFVLRLIVLLPKISDDVAWKMRHCGQSFKTISQTCCESSAFVSAVSRGICQETDGREIDARL